MNDNHEFQQERFYSCIGRLVVSWGHLELWIDLTIAHIHGSLGGKSLQPGKPRLLEAKLTYLRRMAHELPPLAPHRKKVLKLADEVQAAATMRHDLIHGALIGHPDSPAEADMIRLLRKKHEPPAKRFNVTTLAISESMLGAQQLGIRVMNFLHELPGLATEEIH